MLKVMKRSRLFPHALWPVLLATVAFACSIEREIVTEGGVHPPGFTSPDNPLFHGTQLKASGYEMAECRACHGDDYKGGAVSFSCNQSGCHEKGVEWCGTCHDGKAPPEPETGSHFAHEIGCESCHQVPKTAREYKHPNGKVEVTPTGLAEAEGNKPFWHVEDRTCTNTYCHGAVSPVWDAPTGTLACDACHGAPPDSHERFSVGDPPEGCTPCHPGAESPEHLDGTLDTLEPSCGQCHGDSPDGAPPPALDGSTSPASIGVGAHARHLDSMLSDRIGRAVECKECHAIPQTMLAAGHLDDAPPADVKILGGKYNPDTATCVVACHWDKDPGPVWTDTSGAFRACDACHGFPPLVTREGTPHPAVEATVATCLLCHEYAPTTHVDGHVDFLK